MPNCEVCGEPMAEAESMFKFHGYSGPCPKPPLPRPVKVMIEYIQAETPDGYWINVTADRQPYNAIGPFTTKKEMQTAYDDLLNMMRSLGAKDFPSAADH